MCACDGNGDGDGDGRGPGGEAGGTVIVKQALPYVRCVGEVSKFSVALRHVVPGCCFRTFFGSGVWRSTVLLYMPCFFSRACVWRVYLAVHHLSVPFCFFGAFLRVVCFVAVGPASGTVSSNAFSTFL